MGFPREFESRQYHTFLVLLPPVDPGHGQRRAKPRDCSVSTSLRVSPRLSFICDILARLTALLHAHCLHTCSTLRSSSTLHRHPALLKARTTSTLSTTHAIRYVFTTKHQLCLFSRLPSFYTHPSHSFCFTLQNTSQTAGTRAHPARFHRRTTCLHHRQGPSPHSTFADTSVRKSRLRGRDNIPNSCRRLQSRPLYPQDA